MHLARIKAMAPLGTTSARVAFEDGAEGVVDFTDLVRADLVRKGGVFVTLRAPSLTVAEGGRAVAWTDPDGEEADMDADTPRRMVRDARAAA